MTDWPFLPLESLAADGRHAITDGPFGSKLKTEHYTDSGVRVIRLGNIGKGVFRNDDRSFISAAHAAGLKRHTVAEGDLLIAALAEPVGRCCEVPTQVLPAVVKADCIRFRPRDDVNRRFLMYWLNSPEGRQNAEKRSHGVGRLRINMREIRELPVPVPSRSTQDAIVIAIETHLSRIEIAIDALKRAKANVKRARASVLKAGVEGRLVPTEARLARAEGRDYEPAADLLKRVIAERKTGLGANGNPPCREPIAAEANQPPTLPEGWSWATTDAIVTMVTSGSRGWAAYYHDEGTPFIRIGDLSRGTLYVDWVNAKRVRVPHSTERLRTRVRPGDLLVSITADLGVIGVVPNDIPEAYVNQHIALVRPVPQLNGRYIGWFLDSEAGGQRQFRELRKGATKVGLGLDDIRSCRVAVPPRTEQDRIVAEIERRFAGLDRIDSAIDRNLARCDHLRQSILKRAFEGRLVEPDAAPTTTPAPNSKDAA